MYFDAVLNVDIDPVFNGTPEETRNWLKENPNHPEAILVSIGRTNQIVTIEEYLAKEIV